MTTNEAKDHRGHARAVSDEESYTNYSDRPYTDTEQNTAYTGPHYRNPSLNSFNNRNTSPNPSMRAPLLPQIDPSFHGRGY